MIRCGETALFLLESWREVAVLALVLGSFTVLLFYLFGDHVTEEQLRAAGVRVDAVDSPLAYRWLDDAADDSVSPDVVRERAARFNRSDVLVLVAGTRDRLEPSADAVCSNVFAKSVGRAERERYADLIANSERFLLGNENAARADSTCSCAPLLGHMLRYVGVLASLQGDANGTAHKRVEHIFNPLDTLAAAYDELNATLLDAAAVGLVPSVETLDYWFNAARGNYTVLRRKKVHYSGRSIACDEESVTVRGATAVCVQRCLDLLDGVDVRERAHRQAVRAGVQLNAFEQQVSETTASALRDEL